MNLPELVQQLRFTAEGLEKVQGDTTKALTGIGTQVDSFNQKARGVGRALSGGFRGVTRVFQGIGRSIGTVASDVGSFASTIGTAATGAVVTLGKTGFQMASQLELANIQFETLFKSADKAKDHVANLFQFAKKTPFETQPILQASRMMQTFGGDALNTMENITLVGDAAAGTSQGIEEIAFWTGRAYSAIQSGRPFGEAAMRLQELGLLSGDARTAMEELQESGADANEVWGVFTGELGKFTGSMEKQAQTLSGVKSTFNDMVAISAGNVFQGLLDNYKQFFSVINEFGETPAFETIVLNLQKIVNSALDFFAPADKIKALLDNITASDVNTFFESLSSTLGKVYDTFKPLIPVVAGFFSVFASGWLRSLPFVGQFMPMISPVTALLGVLVASSERLQDALMGLGRAFVGVNAQPMIDAFGDFARVVGNILGSVLEDVTPLLEDLFETFADVAPGLLKSISTALAGVADGLSAIISSGLKVVTKLLDELAPIVEDLAPFVSELAGAFGDLVGSALESLAGPVSRLARSLAEVVAQLTPSLVSLMEALSDGIGNLADALGTGLSNLVKALGDGLETIAPALEHILSAGLETITGIIETLGEVLPPVVGHIADFAAAVGEVVAAGLEKIGPPLEQIITAAGTLISAILPKLTILFEGLGPIVIDLASGALNVIADIFSTIASHADILAPALIALATAWAGLKIVDTVTDGVKGFMAGFTGQQGPMIDGIAGATSRFGASLSGGKGLGGVASTAGSMLTSVFNPAMLAVGAVTAIATIAITNYIKKKEEQKQRIKEVTAVMEDETGAIEDNYDAYLKKAVADRSQDDDLKDLNISMETYTAAVNGNKAALSSIIAAQVKQGDENAGLIVQARDLENGMNATRDATEEEIDAWINRSTALGQVESDTQMLITGNSGLVEGIKEERDALKDSTQQRLNQAAAAEELSDARVIELQRLLDLEDGTTDYVAINEELADAERESGKAAEENAAAVQRTADEFDDATAAAEAYNKELDKSLNRNISAEQANLRLTKAFEDLNKELGIGVEVTDENRASIEEARNKMGEFRGEVDEAGNQVRSFTTEGKIGFTEMADEILRTADANIRNGMSVADATAQSELQRQQLIDTYVAMGIGRKEAEDYATTLLGTPEEIATRVTAIELETTKARLQAYIDSIGTIPPDVQTKIDAAMQAGDIEAIYVELEQLTGLPREAIIAAMPVGVPAAQEDFQSLTGDQGTAEVGVDVEEPAGKARDTIKSIEQDDYEAEMGLDPDDGVRHTKSAIEAVEDKEYEAKMGLDPQPAARNTQNTIQRVADKDYEATINVDTSPADAQKSRIDNAARDRDAHIEIILSNYNAIDRQLADLTKTEEKRINIVTTKTGELAEGGPAFANKLYMVGEKGPELFVPSEKGYVYPANHPLVKWAKQMDTLRYVEPAPRQYVNATVASGVVAAPAANRNLAIGSMNIYQDLDLELALTRIGMAMSESTL